MLDDNQNSEPNAKEMPGENESPVGTTETATNEVEIAKAKIENIRQKILAGDTTLTADDLTRARGDLEFAELREAAQIEREEKRAKADRREKLIGLQNQLAEVPAVDAFDKFLSEAGKSLEKYLAQMVKRNEMIEAVETELQSGAFLPSHREYEAVENIATSTGTMHNPAQIGEVEAQMFDPREKAKMFFAEILQKYFPTRGR